MGVMHPKELYWSMGIIIDPPIFDGPPGVGKANKPVFVQAIITMTAVEALDEGILRGLARFDGV